MRITYRNKRNVDYWKDRWNAVSLDSAAINPEKYPMKYALLTINNDKIGSVLEAGCGAGRVLRYLKENGYNVTGFDFIESVVKNLKQEDPELNVHVGNICRLDYKNESFNYILAFGLYHNFNENLPVAINESLRVLKKNGKICASFRADNFQTRITDRLTEQNSRKKGLIQGKEFHKMNLTCEEFKKLFIDRGMQIEKVFPVENMPILYKFHFFRHRRHKNFNESLGREEGYKLSLLGFIIQKILFRFFSKIFCNVYVIIAKKI